MITVLVVLVGAMEMSTAAEMETLDTAASRNSKTRMDTSVSDSTVVVTQSRVELPIFPGQPLELPLHTPFLQVISSVLLLLPS